MADETPPAPSESSDDVTKSETIRITLPPKSEQPAVKRETVRINVPGKPIAPLGTAPKKETTKLPMTSSSEGDTPPPPPPPPAGGKPFVPPPPSPKPPPSAPGIQPGIKPVGGAASPPRPPTIGARPTVPLKPSAAPGGGAAAPEPVTQKAAAPKKETARITLPPEGSRGPLPKATVKMQQTQPLVSRPATAVSTAPLATAVPEPGSDTAINGMAIAALILSLVALATVYLAYSAAGAS